MDSNANCVLLTIILSFFNFHILKKDFATHDDAFNQNSWDFKNCFFKITPVSLVILL